MKIFYSCILILVLTGCGNFSFNASAGITSGNGEIKNEQKVSEEEVVTQPLSEYILN